MKRLTSKTFLGLLLLCFAATAWGQGTRIATVDLTKVFDKYWRTKQAQELLNERKTDLEKDFNNMVLEYKTTQTNYQKLLDDATNPALSSEEKDRRKKAAEEKLKQLKDSEEQIKTYKSQAGVTIEQQGQRLRDNILTEIRNALNVKAKSAGYTLVFDTSAESAKGIPILPYVSRENDLTEDLIDQLNAGQPKETPKTDDKKEEKKEEKKSSPK